MIYCKEVSGVMSKEVEEAMFLACISAFSMSSIDE